MWPPKEISDVYRFKWHPRIEGSYSEFWDDVYNTTKFKNIVELGFNAGHTSHLILSNYNIDSLYSVDCVIQKYTLPCVDALKQKYKNFHFIKSITQNYNYILKNISKNIDLVFVDTFHDFNTVLNDINLSLLLKPEYIVLDDIHRFAVQKAASLFYNIEKTKEHIYHDCFLNTNRIALYKVNLKESLI